MEFPGILKFFVILKFFSQKTCCRIVYTVYYNYIVEIYYYEKSAETKEKTRENNPR